MLEELELLRGEVEKCTKCDISKTCKQKVFSDGNPMSKVMFIGECPGDEEDASGLPFQGKCGQLINKYITAVGLKREDVYICNVLKCRPTKPMNNPTTDTANNCIGYLRKQIKIIDPEFIVCWGTWSAQYVIGNEDPIGQLRGNIFNVDNIQVLPTYHPSYVLRNSSGFKPVWTDMKILIEYLLSIKYNVLR